MPGTPLGQSRAHIPGQWTDIAWEKWVKKARVVGHLAGSVGRVCDSRSRGRKLEPPVRCRDSLKIKSKRRRRRRRRTQVLPVQRRRSRKGGRKSRRGPGGDTGAAEGRGRSGSAHVGGGRLGSSSGGARRWVAAEHRVLSPRRGLARFRSGLTGSSGPPRGVKTSGQEGSWSPAGSFSENRGREAGGRTVTAAGTRGVGRGCSDTPGVRVQQA